MNQPQYRLNGISIIRTLATIGIMLYHIGFGHYYLKQLNFPSGVHLFFCISSFLIMYTTERKTASAFLKRRLIRIVPLYFLLTIFTFVVSKFINGFGQDNISLTEFIKSLLFIPYSRSALKSDFVVRPIVGPAWTLYFDVWFAFVFFIAMKIKHKYRGIITSIICIALCLFSRLLPIDDPFAILLGTGFLLSFVAGIIVYYIWNFFLRNKLSSFPMLWEIGAALLILYLFLGSGNNLSKAIIASLILICTLVSTHQKPVPKLFTDFSKVSFSYYLLHYYVILVVGRVIDFSELNLYTILGTIIVFALTLPLAFCSYVIVEKKLSNILNQL